MRKGLVSPTQYDFAKVARQTDAEVVSVDCRRARLGLISFFAVAWISFLVWRLYQLQLSDEVTRWRQSANKQHTFEMKLTPERGPIFDQAGKPLAVSVPSGSVWARPRLMKDKESASRQLAEHLGTEQSHIQSLLNKDRPFVWVKRQIPRVHAERIAALDIPGVGYFVEARRYYPHNGAASALIGKVGIDGNGLSGLEALYERHLTSAAAKQRVGRDAFGNKIAVADISSSFDLPKGNPLHLTIDSAVQMILDEELEAGREKANAKAAVALMVDADTGEIVAMSQAPHFNFNTDKVSARGDLKNLVVETVFEPGSIMKPIVAAAAIEAGLTKPSELFNCEKGSYRFGKHLINDVHPKEMLSFHQVVVQSSNIGMTKIGMRMGRDRLYSALRQFGFGRSSGIGLPGESAGILRRVSGWAEVDVATHSFGQGIAVTPLQVVRAISAIANGGRLPELSLVKDEHTSARFMQLLSPETAKSVQDMMYGVVDDEHGTGRRAAIPGVKVGGKTGTAQRPRDDGRGYEPGAYIASFVGFADGTELGVNRRLVLLVAVDRPNTTSIYGGTLAAPVFQRAMQRTLHLLTTRNQVNPQFRAPKKPLHQAEEGLLKRVSL